MQQFIGYARVSTQEQDNKLQIDALKAAGCNRIFHEKASGGKWDRTELHRLLDQLREGDTVVVYKLDRLSRSLKDLLLTLEKIEQAGAYFKSLTETIDTSTSGGRMMMQIVGAFAEFERAMLRERTQHGLKSARKQGRIGGRREKLTQAQQDTIISMVSTGQKNAADIARLFNVHRSTISRILKKVESLEL